MRDFKGPWQAYADHQTNKGSFDVFTSEGYLAAKTTSHERMQLIAAAPDLLGALKEMLEAYDDGVGEEDEAGRPWEFEMWQSAYAAVHKALGQ